MRSRGVLDGVKITLARALLPGNPHPLATAMPSYRSTDQTPSATRLNPILVRSPHRIPIVLAGGGHGAVVGGDQGAVHDQDRGAVLADHRRERQQGPPDDPPPGSRSISRSRTTAPPAETSGSSGSTRPSSTRSANDRLHRRLVPVCSPPRPATTRTSSRNCPTDKPVNTGTRSDRSMLITCPTPRSPQIPTPHRYGTTFRRTSWSISR